MSAGSGHIGIVRLLLDNDTDLYAVDKEGLAPAGCAKLFAYKEVEQFLEKKKTLMMLCIIFFLLSL